MTKGPWTETATAHLLPDGRRLHLQHGPIDLILEAHGSVDEVSSAYRQAHAAFKTILPDLVSELPLLRTAHSSSHEAEPPNGDIAKTMVAATGAFAGEFITPMAAVAGSVADHVLTAMCGDRKLTRAYVNNGGDIALKIFEGQFQIGICDDPITGVAGGTVTLTRDDRIGGIATSGWRGRSFSRGIADAVTVLAKTAAMADAAATMIANQVDLPDTLEHAGKITRVAASQLSPDSDLGNRLVTTDVTGLSAEDKTLALSRGADVARAYLGRGLISAAYIALDGERRVIAFNQNNLNDLREAACA